MKVLPARARARYQRWVEETYPRIGPAILVFCIAVSTAAAVGVLWLTKVQNDEQDRRATAIKGILECFDSYTNDASKLSQDTRKVSERVTAAQSDVSRLQVTNARLDELTTAAARERGQALAGVTRLVLMPAGVTDQAAAVQAFHLLLVKQQALVDAETKQLPVQRELADAYDEYADANDALQEFRKNNPVPKPPSTFCDVQP